MNSKIVAVFIGAMSLVGCASSPYDKISASHITRTVQGPVVEVRVQQPSKDLEYIGTVDVATTAVAANNLDNAPVMKGLVVFDVISVLTEKPAPKKYYKPTEFYTILDEKTQERVEISSEDLYAFGAEKAEEGDILRALYAKSKRWGVYNLTKNPELEEKTR